MYVLIIGFTFLEILLTLLSLFSNTCSEILYHQCYLNSTKVAPWGRWRKEHGALQGQNEKTSEDRCSWAVGYEKSMECQRKYQLDWTPFCMKDQNAPSKDEILDCSGSSTFKISSKETYAQRALWSYCNWCSFSNSKFELYDPDGQLRQTHGIAENSPFPLSNDRILDGIIPGEISSSEFRLDRCDVIVDRPAFLFPLCWQIGHLLVDGLEPLFHTMMDAFGRVVTDVYLFIKPAPMGENPGPFDFKRMMDGIEADTPYALLKNFTDHPIYTTGALQNVKGQVCFTKGLFLGLNLTYSYYVNGYDRHPSVADLSRERDRQIANKYEGFKRFMLSNLGLYGHQKNAVFDCPEVQKDDFLLSNSLRSGIVNITYIKRTRLRVLMNEQEVLSTVQNAATEVLGNGYGELHVAQLERMTFTEQVDLFKQTSVLISQWGTGTHNVLFLAPGSVLVLLVHKGFCDWAWIYANQAIFSGVHVYLLCEESPKCFSSFEWIRKGWWEAPFDIRDSNQTVDMDVFQRLLSEILSSLKIEPPWHRPSAAKFINYTKESFQHEDLPLCDVCCRRMSADMPAWVYLSLLVGNDQPISQLQAMVATTASPQDLMNRYPALAVCTKFLGLQSQPHCVSQEKTGVRSTFINVDKINAQNRTIISWLRDERTGKDFYESSSLLPIFTNEDQPYFYSNHFSSIHQTRILAIHVALQSQIVPLVLPVGQPGSLQRCLFCFCSDQPLATSLEDCISHTVSFVHRILKEQYFLQAKLLPLRQHIPHTHNPFVFLDTGSSQSATIIRSIVDGTGKHSLKKLIRCDEFRLHESPLSCSKLDLPISPEPNKQRLEVIAGKFPWNIWKELLQVGTEDVSCLMILQHPVSKFILDYKHHFQEETKKSIDELDAEELSLLLLQQAEAVLNPVFKALCGSQNGSESERARGMGVDWEYSSGQCNLSMAQDSLGKCVIGISEYWQETASIIEFWFPWIPVDSTSTEDDVEARHTLVNLDQTVKKVIEEYSYYDVQLFHYGLKRFQQQQLHILGLSEASFDIQSAQATSY